MPEREGIWLWGPALFLFSLQILKNKSPSQGGSLNKSKNKWINRARGHTLTLKENQEPRVCWISGPKTSHASMSQANMATCPSCIPNCGIQKGSGSPQMTLVLCLDLQWEPPKSPCPPPTYYTILLHRTTPSLLPTSLMGEKQLTFPLWSKMLLQLEKHSWIS